MKIFLIITSVLFLSQSALSQDSLTSYPAISLHAGELLSAQRDFEKTYGSKDGFVFGGGVDFPLIKNVRLVGKTNYFFKSGRGYEWRQWILGGGLKYGLSLSESLALTFSGGMAFTIFLETTPVITVLGRTSGNMIPGLFGGVGVEYSLPAFPTTVFFETEFSSIDWKFPTHTHNYGGTAFSVGVRYHFLPGFKGS